MQSAKPTRRITPPVAFIFTFAALIACSGTRGAVSDPSPAPKFETISNVQLESSMWRLAAGVEHLETIFADPGSVRRSHRLDVIQILDQMIVAADELEPHDLATHHPRMDQDLGRFREKLAIARRSASMNPPRYYLVGNLAGTCLACHGGE